MYHDNQPLILNLIGLHHLVILLTLHYDGHITTINMPTLIGHIIDHDKWNVI